MEPFVYTLKDNQPKNYKNQRWLFLLLGVVYILNGATRIFAEGETGALVYIYFFSGIILVLAGFVNRQQLEDFKISFTNEGIFANTGLNALKSNRLEIAWDKIESYRLAPLKIQLSLKDGSEKEIKLDSLGYHDVRLIKENFRRFALENLKTNDSAG